MRGIGKKATAAVMCGLMGGMLGAPMAIATSPAVAIADPTYENGTVTINAAHNTAATYDGYRLFKAKVVPHVANATSTNVDSTAQAPIDDATDVTWESEAVRTAVLAFLDDNGYAAWLTTKGHTAEGSREIAQNAADFISEQIQNSATDTNAGTTPRTTMGTSFANGLARAVRAAGLVPAVSGKPSGEAYTGTQGFYLFVTTSSTINTDEAGTAPIWVAVSSQPKTITEKSSIPTIAKVVTDDATGSVAGRAADANRNQSVSFRMTGTVADDVNAFKTYYYQMTDTMTNMEMSTAELNAVTVKVDGVDKTAKFTKAFENGVLTVSCPDLLNIDATITKDTQVVVDYQAHLNANAVMGGNGNANEVVLTYSSDPNVESARTVTSPTPSVKTYSYQLDFTKVDQDTREPLRDAQFTIQVADTNSDEASRGKYVQADGSLGNAAYTFTSDAQGQFSVAGIDEGTYVITETRPASDHTVWAAPVTFTISRVFGQDGSLTGLSVSALNGGNGLFVSGTAQDNQDGVGAITASSGVVPLRASDKRVTYLPGTGLTTNAAGAIAGTALVFGGLMVVLRRRKAGVSNAE